MDTAVLSMFSGFEEERMIGWWFYCYQLLFVRLSEVINMSMCDSIYCQG